MKGGTTAKGLCWTAAAVFLAGSIYFFVEHRIRRGDFHSWQTAEPIRLSVDLSKTNTYSAGFTQTCSNAHSQVLRLETGKTFTNEEDAVACVAGLKGRLRIEGHGREGLSNTDFSDVSFVASSGMDPQDHAWRPAVRFYPFRKGIYTLHLEIESDAPALRDVPQQLVARYELCGLEEMPAMVCAGLALACLVLLAMTLAVLRWVTRRQRASPACG